MAGPALTGWLRRAENTWGINAIVSGDAGFSPHSTTWM
jgi:hypothetical protein